MFQKARLKLTAWYLLIIMCISILFSMIIFNGINRELRRIESFQKLRQEERQGLAPTLEQLRREREQLGLPAFPIPRNFNTPDPEIIKEVRARIISILIIINIGIAGIASLAGYFLAGRTLRPIKDMMEEQNRFITDASHELRTPLTSLKSEIEVALRDKKLTSLGAKKLLQSNLEEVNNLQFLSDNLIKLSQYQTSNGNVVLKEVQLAEIIGVAQKKIASLAKNKKITIKNQVADYSLMGDKQSLIEVFVIFLDNAIKYSNKNTSVFLHSKKEDHTVLITIRDEGFGINKEDLPHLFDRFYRVDTSRTKESNKGYGLGLAIAKNIIDQHGGIIKVQSKIGSGTTFFIQLPQKGS